MEAPLPTKEVLDIFQKALPPKKGSLHQEKSYYQQFYDDYPFIKENYNIRKH